MIIWLALTLTGFNRARREGTSLRRTRLLLAQNHHQLGRSSAIFRSGLAFLHGFNHRAAIRAFQQAAEIDPNARWRIRASRCLWSTYYFSAVPPPAAELAWKELSLAQETRERFTG